MSLTVGVIELLDLVLELVTAVVARGRATWCQELVSDVDNMDILPELVLTMGFSNHMLRNHHL